MAQTLHTNGLIALPMSSQLISLRPRARVDMISQNRTVLATDRNDGFVNGEAHMGLFVDETRLLSIYRYRINGLSPNPVALSNVEQHSWLGYYAAPVVSADSGATFGDIPQQVVELKLTRFAGDGFHEAVELRNYSQKRALVELELEADGDFADILEMGRAREQQGKVQRAWRQVKPDIWELQLDYRVENHWEHQGRQGVARLHRGVILRIERPTTPPSYHAETIKFRAVLEPLQSWQASMSAIAILDGRREPPVSPFRRFHGEARNEREIKRTTFFHYATKIEEQNPDALTHTVIESVRRATSDLVDLRLCDLDQSERTWTLAAGVPVYVAHFGRDSLTAAWQSSLLSHDLLEGTLSVLARHQAQQQDDWTEQQPNRLLHQVRKGPLSELNHIPFGWHYATMTTPLFFPVALSELWHWTGERDVVGSLLDTACRCLKWAHEYGDQDGDGFVEYETSSEYPQKNQSWKDSDQAIVHADGSQVEAPIATCESQAFAYAAHLRLAELLWWFDRKDESLQLMERARVLKQRFNEVFWLEEEQFVALALDRRKRPVRSIASNAGHCLASNILDSDRVERVAERLFARDLFSGWGVRTLSSDHPAYNPYAYQRGNVWPAEQAAFALGFWRWGLRSHAAKLCRAQFEACELFDYYRLPECFGGQPRDARHPFPALYTRANWPQAWSSSAILLMLQSLLGIYPFAPLNLLAVDPELPDWLPQLTLRGLRVGRAEVSLRFWRNAHGRTKFEVLDKRGTLHVVRQPSPWSLDATAPERVRDLLVSAFK